MRYLTGGMILLAAVLPVQAAELPWSSAPYSHYSEQEPVGEVLKGLLASYGIPVVVSSAVKEEVSAQFERLPPREIFHRLMSTYNLTWYFDGQVLYVYRGDEVRTGTVRLRSVSVEDFSQTLKRLGILDARFRWTTSPSDGLIFFSGPERFVNLVMEMATELDRQSHHKVYKWRDRKGITHFSSAPPVQRRARVEVIRLPVMDLDHKRAHRAPTEDVQGPAAGARPQEPAVAKRSPEAGAKLVVDRSVPRARNPEGAQSTAQELPDG